MNNTVNINTYSHHITDEQLTAIFNKISIDPQQDYTTPIVDLWDLSIRQTGYGHWRISVHIDINGEEVKISTITTDSISIDNYNSEDDDEIGEGFINLLTECINDNEDEIISVIIG